MSPPESVRRKQVPRRPSAGTGRPGADDPDPQAALDRLRREDVELRAVIEEQELKLAYLTEKREKTERFCQEYREEVDRKVAAMEKVAKEKLEKEEKNRREHLELDKKRESLERRKAELLQRTEELRREVQKYSVYGEVMEECRTLAKLQIGEFKDAKAFADYAETQLEMRNKLYKKWVEKQELADKLRKQKAKLDDEYNLTVLQRNNELRRLDQATEKYRTEADYWQRKWDEIEEVSTEREREIGQIKLATLNMYETIGGEIGGTDGVDLTDTEAQLDRIMTYMLDLKDILDRYEASLKTGDDGQKKKRGKKKGKSILARPKKK